MKSHHEQLQYIYISLVHKTVLLKKAKIEKKKKSKGAEK